MPLSLSDLLNTQPDPGYRLDEKLTFGKWSGSTLRGVIHFDIGYITWALENKVILLSKEAEDYYNSQFEESADVGDGLPF